MSGTVFIGLPVRNGGDYLRTALESVIRQTYQDWRLLVSDNSSTDATVEIVEEYRGRDSRISLRRQHTNLGSFGNFRFCAESCPAEATYFAWFAHDDAWEPEFLAATAGRLEREPDAGFAWTNVYALDSFDQCQGISADYSRYSGDMVWPAARYVLEHESCGKAMLVQSVFRPELMRAALAAIPEKYREPNWDNIFNLACLSRGALVVDKRPLFGKRAPRPTDAPGHLEAWRITFDPRLGLNDDAWRDYFDAMGAVVAGTRRACALKGMIWWRRHTRHFFVPRRALASSSIVVSE
jgi:glycosyltransferase involved in cell wall biosynthesis